MWNVKTKMQLFFDNDDDDDDDDSNERKFVNIYSDNDDHHSFGFNRIQFPFENYIQTNFFYFTSLSLVSNNLFH